MAINLNPGADATLVTAATRAGFATAPADYSTTFENVAKSYEKTMEAQGQMWKDIGKVVGVIGADMVANAQEWNNYKEVGEKNATYLVDELEANKQAQKDLGLLPGILGDKETRDEKRRLKSRQRELFAEIDFVSESLNTGAETVAAGLFDENLAPQDAEMINAIIKSNLKDKITESGFQTVLGRDEKTDQLIFNLLDKDGNPVTSDATGEPITMTVKEFNKSIATNVKDTKNVMGTGMSTIENEVATLASKSKSDIIDDQTLQLSLNKLDGLLQTDTDVRRAMQAKYGYSNTSFADDIQTKGPISEEIYASLVRTIGAEKSGQVKAEGTLAGIADTDDKLGLSQEEIENAYSTYSTNILGMKDPEVSKAVFKASYANRMREAHTYGYSKRTIKTDEDKGKTGKYGGWGSYNWTTKGTADQEGAHITWQDAEKRRTDLDNFRDVGGAHGYYKWNPDLGNNGMYVDESDNEFSMYQVADREGLMKTGESAKMFNPITKSNQNLDQQRAGAGLATSTMLKTGGDDAVSSNLNATFDLTGRQEKFLFVPWTTDLLGKGGDASWAYDADISDSMWSNDITLVDPTNNYRPLVNPKTNEPYRFKTGKKFKQTDLDIINKIMEDAGYIRKQETADDITTYTTSE